MESSTCYPSPKGSLGFRCVFPLISHICISWVVQSSEGRTRPLLSGAKVTAINMPGFGIEGWGKRRVIFIFP